jgi:BirA family biotin operon repressor/biotin-[acetyl-CoA-carboxylase] ligase
MNGICAPLLDALLNSQAPLDADDLARRLGLQPREMAAALGQLAVAGCELEHHPHGGLRLLRSGPGTWADYLRWACPAPPQRIIAVYRQTGSTQDVARQIIEAHGRGTDGAVIVADEQTAGRGRLGRRWVAPRGTGITFSRIAIIGGAAHVPVDRLVLNAAVAVARGIEAATTPESLKIGIKWPNDLLVGGRKIAGILVETLPLRGGGGAAGSAAIIGVGINVALTPGDLPAQLPGQAHLAGRITSLAMCGRTLDRLQVLTRTVQHLDRALENPDPAGIMEEWRRRSVLTARRITLANNCATITGEVIDVDPEAGLILRTDSGELVHLHAGTTSVVDF